MKGFAELIENNVKTWQQNEKRKERARKKVLWNNVYPNDRDIYGKEVNTNGKR